MRTFRVRDKYLATAHSRIAVPGTEHATRTLTFFFIEKSFVTNCLLTFSNCCVGNDYDVRGKIPVNFPLLFFIAWMTGISSL